MNNATQTEIDRFARQFGYHAANARYPYTLIYRYAGQLAEHPDHVMYYTRDDDRAAHAAAIKATGGTVTGASGGNTAGLAGAMNDIQAALYDERGGEG